MTADHSELIFRTGPPKRSPLRPSEESAGLLRMLDCGSDATPEAEEPEGAYGKLIAHGVDGLRAEVLISELARMGRRQAQAYLTQQKFSESAQADILSATHCNPPASYLLLTSAIKPQGGWWNLANWDFRKADVVKRERSLPETRAVAEMVSRLGYSESEARSTYERAAALKSQAEEQAFISPPISNLNSGWKKCEPGDSGTLNCKLDMQIDETTVVKQMIFRPANPADSRLVAVRESADGTSTEAEITPPVILIAAADQVGEVSNPAPEYPELAVLVDVPGARVLLANPDLLRSTFSRLMNLDGKYQQFFDKVQDETGFGGEHVKLWRINWKRLEDLD